jgi:hypothetical protein
LFLLKKGEATGKMSDQYEDVIGRLDRLEKRVDNLEEQISMISQKEDVLDQTTAVLLEPPNAKHVVKKCATSLSPGERSFVETEEARVQLTNARRQTQAKSKPRALKRRRSQRKRNDKSDQSLRKRIFNKFNFL